MEKMQQEAVEEKTPASLLRELEVHLACVQIGVKGDIMPHAGINCARIILADAMLLMGLTPDEKLPPIDPDET